MQNGHTSMKVEIHRGQQLLPSELRIIGVNVR